jgi:hypothetical protein
MAPRKKKAAATQHTDRPLSDQFETAHHEELTRAMDQVDIDRAVSDTDELEAATVDFDPAKLEAMAPSPVMTPVLEHRAPVMPTTRTARRCGSSRVTARGTCGSRST